MWATSLLFLSSSCMVGYDSQLEYESQVSSLLNGTRGAGVATGISVSFSHFLGLKLPLVLETGFAT